MQNKEAIEKLSVDHLSGVPQTLLIPLASRVYAHKHAPKLGFQDPAALELEARIHLDLENYAADRASAVVIAYRSQILDNIVRAFLAQNPKGLCVSLGSGLSTQFARVDNGQMRWVDLDLPEVAVLREKLLPPGPRCKLLTGSALDFNWMDMLGWNRGDGPVLVICEGLLPYLQPHDAHTLIGRIAEKFGAGSQLAFDYVSQHLAGRAMHLPLFRKMSKRPQVDFHWGVQDVKEILDCHPRLKVLAHEPLLAKAGFPAAQVEKIYGFVKGVYLYGVMHLALG